MVYTERKFVVEADTEEAAMAEIEPELRDDETFTLQEIKEKPEGALRSRR